jgi:RND family efflux transporter MFP subunit
MRHHPLRWITAACAVLACAVAAALWWLPPKVAVVQPRRGPALQAVYATGTVEATVMLPIAARITARLAELDTDEGHRVRKGELLGRLEDRDLSNAVAQLRSQAAFAKSDYERNAALVRSGMVPQTTYDKSRSDWLAASAASTKATAELEFTRLLAPADGVVIHRDGEVGEMIPVNQPVFWIAVDSPLRISAEVDEEDIARVQPGQEVLIRADAFPNRVFHGHVQSITPKGDPVARSYRVRIGFSEDTPLLIGMTAEVNIVIRRNEQALLLPPSAVAANRVWRVARGRVEPRAVVVGASGADAVEIVQGVDAGDVIVAAPDADLRQGEAVRIVFAGLAR